MNLTRRHAAGFGCLLLLASSGVLASAPVEWDGLRQVSSKRMDLVYVQPGADFRGYSKVIVEPTEVAFHKNWQRDHNSSTRERVSDRDIQEAISKGTTAASDIFAEAWRKGGYEPVSEPGPDVLRVRTAVANISVSAPDVRSSRSYTFSDTAGHATLVLEVKDSMTGALLGRAVDRGVAGDTSVGSRTSGSNRADFRYLVEAWAKDSVRGLSELKALSPIQR